jgi:hypothetical protein
MTNRLRAVLLFILVVALAGCTGPEAGPSATATAQLSEATTTTTSPAGVAFTPSAPMGPAPTWTPAPEVHRDAEPADDVLYFLKDQNPRVLVAYDVEAGEVYWSRNLGSGIDPTVAVPTFKVAKLGKRIAISNGRSIELVTADGANGGTLFHLIDDSIEDIAASPDGRYLAIAVELAGEPIGTPAPDGAQGYRRRSAVQFLDASSGQIVQTIDSSRPELADFRGSFYWLNWRDDSLGVVVSGATFSENPGGDATLLLDGSVRVHPVEGYGGIAPNGRLMAHGPSTFGCLAIAGHTLSILDLDSGRNVVSTGSDDEALTGLQWSPDSSEYLFTVRPYDPADACGFDQNAPEQLRLLDVATGEMQPVPDRRALFLRWYGSELIEAKGCGFIDGPLAATRWQEYLVTCLPGGAIGVGSFLLDGREIVRSDYFELVGWARK